MDKLLRRKEDRTSSRRMGPPRIVTTKFAAKLRDGRCSGLSVVRGRLRGLSWGNRPHFGADQPRRGARCDGPTSTSACWPTVLPSGIVALRGRLTHGPRSPAARRA